MTLAAGPDSTYCVIIAACAASASCVIISVGDASTSFVGSIKTGSGFFLVFIRFISQPSLLILPHCVLALLRPLAGDSIAIFASVPNLIIELLFTFTDQYPTHHVSGFSFRLIDIYSTLVFKYS